MRKHAIVLGVLSALAFGALAGPASADITPNNTQITATSSNATFTVLGFINITCQSGVSFNTSSGTNSANLNSDVSPYTAAPRFSSCSGGSTSTTTANGQWGISGVESSGATDTTDDSSTGTVSFNVPSGGATVTAIGCTVRIGATTLTAPYTDGATSITVSGNVPYTRVSGFFCPSSGTAPFSGTYTLSQGVTIR